MTPRKRRLASAHSQRSFWSATCWCDCSSGCPTLPQRGPSALSSLMPPGNFPDLTHFQQGYTGYAAFLMVGNAIGNIEWYAVFAQSVAAVLATRLPLSLRPQLAEPAPRRIRITWAFREGRFGWWFRCSSWCGWALAPRTKFKESGDRSAEEQLQLNLTTGYKRLNTSESAFEVRSTANRDRSSSLFSSIGLPSANTQNQTRH